MNWTMCEHLYDPNFRCVKCGAISVLLRETGSRSTAPPSDPAPTMSETPVYDWSNNWKDSLKRLISVSR